ncbi:MAG: hypothetical protein N4A35_09050 [Flavobacteriales bacterium]|jgi:hypothetical protein|nr:hypothetical protein [Flavobacteriales bacterium]
MQKEYTPPTLEQINNIDVDALNPMGWDSLTVVKRTIPQQINDYTKWNEWIVMGANLVQTMDAVLLKAVSNEKAITAINAACHSFYDAAVGMNNEIVTAINGLEATPPVEPVVEFPPNTLPPWPITSKPNLFSSVWGTVQPLLQMLDQKLVKTHPDDPIVVALGGLISAGENIVDVLSTYYPKWAPKNK